MVYIGLIKCKQELVTDAETKKSQSKTTYTKTYKSKWSKWGGENIAGNSGAKPVKKGGARVR